jgi:hypothetical protein
VAPAFVTTTTTLASPISLPVCCRAFNFVKSNAATATTTKTINMPELCFSVVWMGSGHRPLPGQLKLEFKWRKTSKSFSSKLARLLQEQVCLNVPGITYPHFVKAFLGPGGPELTLPPHSHVHLKSGDNTYFCERLQKAWLDLCDSRTSSKKRRKVSSASPSPPGWSPIPTLILSQYSQREVDIAYITFKAEDIRLGFGMRGSASDLEPLNKRHLTDRHTFMAVVHHLGVICYNQASREIQRDNKVTYALLETSAIRLWPDTVIDIFRCNPALRCDRNFVLLTLSLSVSLLRYMSDELKCDCDFAKDVMHRNPSALIYFSDAVRADVDVVLAALHKNALALEYAAQTIRSERKVVMAAVRANGSALKYASESLRADRELVLAAVGQDGRALEYAFETLRADFDVVLCAIKNRGSMLRVASDALRANKELVLAAVSHTSDALEYAAFELRDDVEVVTTALRSSRHSSVAEFVSDRLRANREIALLMVSKRTENFRLVLGDLHCDEEVARAALACKYGMRDARGYMSESLYENVTHAPTV